MINTKAKDYAERYKASGNSPDTLKGIAFDMLLETKILAEQRRVRTNSALFAILDEICAKWRAFARLSGDEQIRPDGLDMLIMKEFGVVYLYWKQSEKNRRR